MFLQVAIAFAVANAQYCANAIGRKISRKHFTLLEDFRAFHGIDPLNIHSSVSAGMYLRSQAQADAEVPSN